MEENDLELLADIHDIFTDNGVKVTMVDAPQIIIDGETKEVSTQMCDVDYTAEITDLIRDYNPKRVYLYTAFYLDMGIYKAPCFRAYFEYKKEN